MNWRDITVFCILFALYVGASLLIACILPAELRWPVGWVSAWNGRTLFVWLRDRWEKKGAPNEQSTT